MSQLVFGKCSGCCCLLLVKHYELCFQGLKPAGIIADSFHLLADGNYSVEQIPVMGYCGEVWDMIC